MRYSPSWTRARLPELACVRRAALSVTVSRTRWRSKLERAIEARTCAIAVSRSSASWVSSRTRASRRATAACSAKVTSNRISASVKASTRVRHTDMTPTGAPSVMSGIPMMLRNPASFWASCSSYSASASTSTICTGPSSISDRPMTDPRSALKLRPPMISRKEGGTPAVNTACWNAPSSSLTMFPSSAPISRTVLSMIDWSTASRSKLDRASVSRTDATAASRSAASRASPSNRARRMAMEA